MIFVNMLLFMVFYILQVVQIVLQFSVELNIQEDYKSCVFKLTADTSCKMNYTMYVHLLMKRD